MQYMLLIYDSEAEAQKRSDAELGGMHQEYMEFTQGIARSGHLKAGDALERTSSATTVRVRNGKTATVDGPFAETKEQLAGYYILDCKDLDEAIEWAAKIPTACRGGTGGIEIRPMPGLAKLSPPEREPERAGARNA